MIEQETSSGRIGVESSKTKIGETFETRPIGEFLRRQRMLREMSIDELAQLTRIPLRSLERLESGQFDGETDGFVRGFVRTVASALGLDADDAVTRMLQEPDPSSWERHSSGRNLKQGLVAVALVSALVVTFFVMRAGWGLLLGTASTPASREVVLWHDPVRALAEATGIDLDAAGQIEPGNSTQHDSANAVVGVPDAVTRR